MPRKKKAPTQAVATFTITVNTGDKVITGSGESLYEALKALTPPEKIVKKTIVTLSSGDKTKEILFTVPKAKRIFFPITHHILAKHFALLLK